MRPVALAAVALLAACAGVGDPGEVSAPTAAHRILLIGNSLTYSNDLPGMLAALLERAEGQPSTVESVAFANYGLEDHWRDGRAREAIRRGGWDLVIVQQGPSATEGRPSLLEYGRRFADVARAAGAGIGFYAVWPSRARRHDFDGVGESYRMAAEATGGLLLPAGDAWRRAWAREPALDLYGADGFHPTPLGTYLAALVLFEGITGRTPVGLPASLDLPSGRTVRVDPGRAGIAQEAAQEAAAEVGGSL